MFSSKIILIKCISRFRNTQGINLIKIVLVRVNIEKVLKCFTTVETTDEIHLEDRNHGLA